MVNLNGNDLYSDLVVKYLFDNNMVKN